MTLPWLSYVEEAPDVRDGTDIEMQMTFDSQMKILLAKYSLDGTWLGMEEMSTQVMGCRGVLILVCILVCAGIQLHRGPASKVALVQDGPGQHPRTWKTCRICLQS